MSTKFVTSRLPGPFGLSVSGISLPDLDDHALKTLLHTLYANRFLVIRTGGLSESEYVRFARRVGQPISFNSGAPFPEIIPITNVGVDTLSDRLGAAHWHTDQSFTRELSSVTMLYSVAAPAIGGETRFCDMVAAYEALPATKRQARLRWDPNRRRPSIRWSSSIDTALRWRHNRVITPRFLPKTGTRARQSGTRWCVTIP